MKTSFECDRCRYIINLDESVSKSYVSAQKRISKLLKTIFKDVKLILYTICPNCKTYEGFYERKID